MNFDELQLSPLLLKALDQKGYTKPSPIQEQAIPYVLNGQDLLGCAQTGTGKTAAFALPIIQNLMERPKNRQKKKPIRSLILTPTRELALQIHENIEEYGASTPINSAVIFGGVSAKPQIQSLRRGIDILVATPGRLLDLIGQHEIDLSFVEIFVLDEADRMLDMGFVRDVTRILDLMPKRKNLGMFSATISREVMDISWVYQRDPVEITVRADQENKPDILQYRLEVERNRKVDTMVRLMELGGYDRVIAFCNTKNMTDRLTGLLKMRDISCEGIHGDIQQRVREKTLQRFRNGELRVLVATDVAARGLDIDDVDAVFNYDVPDENEYYIHRIGRTGRARRRGAAYTLVSTITESIRLDDIRKNTGNEIRAVRFNEAGELEEVGGNG